MHRRRVSSNSIRRRWILVGLLPYLVLLLTNGGFHHHPGAPSPGGEQPFIGSSAQAIFLLSQADRDDDCPGCKWLASASNCLLTAPLPLQFNVESELSALSSPNLTAFSPLFLTIRGPPSA